MKYIEELIAYKEDVDAVQIAEILWLSQFMGSASSEVEKPNPTPKRDDTIIEEPKKEDLPEPIDTSTPSYEDKKEKYGFDKEQDNGSMYTTNITQKEKFPEIEKQFQSLKVKQNCISKESLDEVKTADYIATTGYFHPIFSEIKSKESYFSLHIIIDKSESMFLWESYTKHFIKSMKFSTIFTSIRIFELDSSQKEPSVYAMDSDHSINLNSAIFREEKSITLVFSDITGDSWKSNRMFEVLDRWSKGSFVTIVSMLPKRMWKKTPLRQGISLFMKPRKFLPKNKDLKAEFDFMRTKTTEKGTNIPMLTFDSYAFSHLSNVLMSKKESWIDTRTFKNLVIKEVAKSKKSNISPKERVKNFFSFALPKTRELAVYCSVLPLTQEIIKEVIKARDLGTEKDVFSEFYFGGLIDKDAEVTFGEYAFYEGVAKELRQYISVQEMKILLHQVSEVMSSSFGVDTKRLNLLYESANDGEELNDNERALVELMIEVLEDKGRFYEGEVEKLVNILEKKENNLKISLKDNERDIVVSSKELTKEDINNILRKKGTQTQITEFWNFIKTNYLHDFTKTSNIQMIMYLIDNFRTYEKENLKYYEIYQRLIEAYLLLTTDNERKKQLKKLSKKEIWNIVSFIAFKRLKNNISAGDNITEEMLSIVYNTALFKEKSYFFNESPSHSIFGKTNSIISYLSACWLIKLDSNEIIKKTTHKLGTVHIFEDVLVYLTNMRPELFDKLININPFIFRQHPYLTKSQQQKLLESILDKLQNNKSVLSNQEQFYWNSTLTSLNKLKNIESILREKIDKSKVDSVLYFYLLHLPKQEEFVFEILETLVSKNKEEVKKIIKYCFRESRAYSISSNFVLKLFDLMKKNDLFEDFSNNKNASFELVLFDFFDENNQDISEYISLFNYIPSNEYYKRLELLKNNELEIYFEFLEKNYNNNMRIDVLEKLLSRVFSYNLVERIVKFLEKNKLSNLNESKNDNSKKYGKNIDYFWEIYFKNKIENIEYLDELFDIFSFSEDDISKIISIYPIEKYTEKYRELLEKNLVRDINNILFKYEAFEKERLESEKERLELDKIIQSFKEPKKIKFKEEFDSQIELLLQRNDYGYKDTPQRRLGEEYLVFLGKLKDKFKNSKLEILKIEKNKSEWQRENFLINYPINCFLPFIEIFSKLSIKEVLNIIDTEEEYKKLFWLWLHSIQNYHPFQKYNIKFFELTKQYSTLLADLLIESFELFLKYTDNRKISNSLRKLEIDILNNIDRGYFFEYSKSLSKEIWKSLESEDRAVLLRFLDEESFGYIVNLLKYDTEHTSQYLRVLFSIDTNRTIEFFIKHYRENGKSKELYSSLITSFYNKINLNTRIFFIDKIEEKYIKELVIDFYNNFNEDKTLALPNKGANYRKFDTGLWHYIKSKEIFEELAESSSPRIVETAKLKLKWIYDEEAEIEYLDDFEIFGENDPDDSLANLHMSKGEYNEAESLYKKFLLKNKERFGGFDSTTATSYFNLAVLYDKKKDFEKAYHFMQKTIKLHSKIFNENNANLLYSKERLKKIKEELLKRGERYKLDYNVFFECKKCNASNGIHCSQLLWEAIDGYETDEGMEFMYQAIDNIICDRCNNEIEITFSCLETSKEKTPWEIFSTESVNFKGDCCPDNSLIKNEEKEKKKDEDFLINVNLIQEWFYQNYENSTNALLYKTKEGTYQYINGEPRILEEILFEKFKEEYLEDTIKEAVEKIKNKYGDIEWSPIFQNKDKSKGMLEIDKVFTFDEIMNNVKKTWKYSDTSIESSKNPSELNQEKKKQNKT